MNNVNKENRCLTSFKSYNPYTMTMIIHIPLFLALDATDGMIDCRTLSSFFSLPRLLYQGIFTRLCNSS